MREYFGEISTLKGERVRGEAVDAVTATAAAHAFEILLTDRNSSARG